MKELNNHSLYMDLALEQARIAYSLGEVPVGCVIVRDSQIIGAARNQVENDKLPTAHAECLAIARATASISNWRLEGATCYVTLEPCPMCISALGLARIDTVVFGCNDYKMGACGSVFDLSSHSELPFSIKVISGVKAEESLELLQRFFASIRI